MQQHHLILDRSLGRFHKAPETDFLGACILPVFAIDGQAVNPLGTAFAISTTGILLTAAHVIERNRGGELFVLYESKEVGSVRLPVEAFKSHPEADIGVLKTGCPRTDTGNAGYNLLPFSSHLPEVGQECAAWGYGTMDPTLLVNNHLGARWSLDVTVGEVEVVYPRMRDVAVFSFPCFQTNQLLPGGMSGSPVATGDGRVVGVASKSFDDDPDYGDGSNTTHVTLLARALEIELPMSLDGTPAYRTLGELAEAAWVGFED